MVGLACVLTAVFGMAVSPPKADALVQSYCGFIASSGPYGCYSGFNQLTYSSARYSGGGNITTLGTALLFATGAERGGVINAVSYGTFTSICFYSRSFTRGASFQNDGGANHTIAGTVDDSYNHTGCVS